ncbi:Leucine-rich repeat SHOC-2, partial [Paramuricea clavata]
MDEHRLSEAETQPRENTRSAVRERRPNSTIDQQEVLQEKLNTLEHSRRGYLGSLTRIYNQIDVLLSSYDNVVQVKEFHSKLRLAWHQYEACCVHYLTLIDKKGELYKRVSAQYEEQTFRKQTYDVTVDQYVTDSLVHFNAQVMEDVARQKTTSVGSDISKISSATSKLREAKLAATKASLIKRQTESRKKRALQLELAKMDMEIKRKEFEYNQHLELAHIETENEVERNSAHPATADHIPPTGQSNVPKETSPLRDNPNANRATSILLLRGGIKQTHQFPTDAPAYPEPLCYLPPATKSQRQSASPTHAKNTSDVNRRLWNQEDVTVPQPTGSTPFVQNSLLSSLSFPVFRQRFEQLVQSKLLDKSTKMSCLLQLLDGAPLNAVKRYKTIPGGLTRVMKLLEDRFGRPCQIVRACVDSLTKGPMIAPNDKQGLQKYADDVQVMYDTLNSINCLVDFLKDRADVANHPFFSKTSESNRDEKVFGGGQRRSSERRTILTTRSNNRDDVSKEQLCPMCNNLHLLYRCKVFKSKSPEKRGEFVKRNRICFNCINSKEHISRTCNSSIRCRSPGCGKPHHTLLHMSSPPKEKKTKSDVGTMTLSIDEFKSTNNLTSKQRNEVLLQVIPLRIINEDGNQPSSSSFSSPSCLPRQYSGTRCLEQSPSNGETVTSQLQHISEMFPFLDHETISKTLSDANMNVEVAIDKLLGVTEPEVHNHPDTRNEPEDIADDDELWDTPLFESVVFAGNPSQSLKRFTRAAVNTFGEEMDVVINRNKDMLQQV